MQSSTDREVSLGWSDQSVPLHTHACFYYSDETTLRSSLKFLRVGLDAPGEFNVIFADASRHDSLLGWLQEGYPGTVADHLESGKLAVVGGAPTREQLLAGIAATLDRAMAAGCRVIRFLGFIAWGRDGWPDESTLLQFESEVNSAVSAYPAVIICTCSHRRPVTSSWYSSLSRRRARNSVLSTTGPVIPMRAPISRRVGG